MWIIDIGCNVYCNRGNCISVGGQKKLVHLFIICHGNGNLPSLLRYNSVKCNRKMPRKPTYFVERTSGCNTLFDFWPPLHQVLQFLKHVWLSTAPGTAGDEKSSFAKIESQLFPNILLLCFVRCSGNEHANRKLQVLEAWYRNESYPVSQVILGRVSLAPLRIICAN